MKTIKQQIEEVGVDNCLFLFPMRPLRSILGIRFTSSQDDSMMVPCTISEERYKLKENYKITLISMYPQFGKEHLYLSDLGSLVKRGVAQFYTKNHTEEL